jgi:hypothetical protein
MRRLDVRDRSTGCHETRFEIHVIAGEVVMSPSRADLRLARRGELSGVPTHRHSRNPGWP